MANIADTTLEIHANQNDIEFYDRTFPAITFNMPNPEIGIYWQEFRKYVMTLQFSILSSLYPGSRRFRGRISYMRSPVHKMKWIRALKWSEYVISELDKMNISYSELANESSEFRQGSDTQRDCILLLNERLHPEGEGCLGYFDGRQDEVLFGRDIDWNRLEAEMARDSYTESSYELIGKIAPLLDQNDEQLKVMRKTQILHYMGIKDRPRFESASSGILNAEELAKFKAKRQEEELEAKRQEEELKAKRQEEERNREREMRGQRTRGVRTDPGFLRANKGQGDSGYQSGSGSQGSEEEKKPPTCSHKELLSGLLGHFNALSKQMERQSQLMIVVGRDCKTVMAAHKELVEKAAISKLASELEATYSGSPQVSNPNCDTN